MIYAYNELYIDCAQRMMGDMYDYAVNTLDISLSEFQKMFLVSSISKQISIGNPMYVAGLNGCEVAKQINKECTGIYPTSTDIMYLDKSAEYWLGWVICYYQWLRNIDFKTIENVYPITDMIDMYPTLHEADVSVSIMDEKLKQYRQASMLKRLRAYAHLTQSELSTSADVPLRQIQLFEQGQRDINKCQVSTIIKLAKALNCSVETLTQPTPSINN